MSLPYVGTLVNYNSKYLSSPIPRDSPGIGYVIRDIGDYIRFIDRHGMAYLVPRSNVSTSYLGPNLVYNVVGPFYNDLTQPNDKMQLSKFLALGVHP